MHHASSAALPICPAKGRTARLSTVKTTRLCTYLQLPRSDPHDAEAPFLPCSACKAMVLLTDLLLQLLGIVQLVAHQLIFPWTHAVIQVGLPYLGMHIWLSSPHMMSA